MISAGCTWFRYALMLDVPFGSRPGRKRTVLAPFEDRGVRCAQQPGVVVSFPFQPDKAGLPALLSSADGLLENGF